MRHLSCLNSLLERALLIRSASESNKNKYLYIKEMLVIRIPGKRKRLSKLSKSKNLVDATSRTMAKRLMVPFKIRERNIVLPLGCIMDSIAATMTKGSNIRRRFMIILIGSLEEIRMPTRSTVMTA
jgi:hypothetical protein